MRHRKAGRKLGRNASHRLALMRSLTMALIRHERIVTTVAKAKEVRPFVEKLVTLAKKGTLHARRLAAARLGPMADAEVAPGEGDDADHRPVLVKLFADLGPRFADRPGGYTRILKRHERRLGDAGETAFIEFLKEGEQKRERTRAPAAPRVEEEEETGGEEQAPETQGQGEGAAPQAGAPEASGPAATGEASAQQPPAGGGGTPPENPPKA
jgi:large subunit ribosomal protein L17